MERKQAYFAKLQKLFGEYDRLFVVSCDNVGSQQMHNIRRALRAHSVVQMGKNTLIRKVINDIIKEHPGLKALLPFVKGNIGFVFTNGDLKEVKDAILNEKVGAPARAGAVAPCDVVVPKGNTGMEPTQTQFLQALNIASKIARGTIEIINDVHLIHEGDKVGSSEAILLQKLSILPFTYGLRIVTVYEGGATFDDSVLELTDKDKEAFIMEGIANVAALSLGANMPTLAAMPHIIADAYKNVLGVALECEEFSFAQADLVKEMLADPSKFAAAAPEDEEEKPADDAVEAPAEEEDEEEEDSDMDFGGLF